ncbi:transcriptional pleiotropic repressor [Desulfonispora thiosulfatigenes DSM 11270]|uniref:Global transcriptional regulator CodY n=1 Tax=Desulfonispora thiosulfatigenes DSM 11270 TaxID=656914 RepID=A0A1W1UXF6_DESTI|nr:GTP-sensing pleiotropic transcriptional regulator CodY [Desulfonispora thiosulfatigenes]SMB85756.1 transcriptional pleiotropic repressor [Desulfonispora thiosulfatigenes DSM 11270]
MDTQVLLEKTRVMHQLLQKASSNALQFDNIATELKSVLDCNVYIIDKEGKLLGRSEIYELSTFGLEELEGKQFSEECIRWFSGFNQTEVNIDREESKVIVTPVLTSGEKMGAVIYARKEQAFSPLEVILAEYGSSVAGMQIMRTINLKIENEARKKNVVQLALEVLSYSELEAVKYIFNEIEGSEGFLVASKLAEQYKLTRSVIVNALRKLESAGVIDARSLGMKGTYIKVLNDYLYDELAEV